jgi:hypothetical protein
MDYLYRVAVLILKMGNFFYHHPLALHLNDHALEVCNGITVSRRIAKGIFNHLFDNGIDFCLVFLVIPCSLNASPD